MILPRFLVAACASAILVSCAAPQSQTGYQNSDNFGVRTGFSEEQLSDNSYRIQVLANSRTDRARVHDIALYRAAALTIEQGLTHFIILEGKRMVRRTTATKGGVPQWTIDEPVYEIVIELYSAADLESDPTLMGRRPAEAAQIVSDIGPRLDL